MSERERVFVCVRERRGREREKEKEGCQGELGGEGGKEMNKTIKFQTFSHGGQKRGSKKKKKIVHNHFKLYEDASLSSLSSLCSLLCFYLCSGSAQCARHGWAGARGRKARDGVWAGHFACCTGPCVRVHIFARVFRIGDLISGHTWIGPGCLARVVVDEIDSTSHRVIRCFPSGRQRLRL